MKKRKKVKTISHILKRVESINKAPNFYESLELICFTWSLIFFALTLVSITIVHFIF